MTIFIGYSKLSDLPLHDADQLCVMCYAQEFAGNMAGFSRRSSRLIVQVAKDGAVHYWQFPYGSEELLNGELMNPERNKRIVDHGDQIYAAVIKWLGKKMMVRHHHAIIAMPKDYNFLDGDLDVLQYDKEHGFTLRTAEKAKRK